MARVIRTVLVLGAFLVAGRVPAQAAQRGQTPPAQTPPVTQAPPLIPPKPAPPPAAAKPATPFPAEAKVAFINMQDIFNDSDLGKQGLGLLKALNDKLSAGLAAREKEIQGLSERIRTQQGLVKMDVIADWNKDLQRLQREGQFAQQEAQVQVSQLQEDLLAQFQTRVQPVIEAIRAEKGLWIVFSIDSDNGGLSVAASYPGVDLSTEVTKRLNAAKS